MEIKVAGAWSKGKLHAECQDMVNVCKGKIYSLNNEDRCKIESDYGLVVVSDGAGSKEHSAVGAFTVTKAIEKYFTQIYEWNSFDQFDLEKMKAELLQYMIQEIISIEAYDDVISNYACTLVFVLYIDKSKKYIYGHIGDGGIVGLEDKILRIISQPENGEYVNQTYFITDVDAANHFRMGIGSNESKQLGFLLCTDGVSSSLFKSTKIEEKISPVCDTFFQWLIETETEEDIISVSKAYEDNLHKYFSTRSNDDLSLGVMTVS